MKIVYITSTGFLDGDLPLIKELQKNGIDVYVFLVLAPWSRRSTLIDIKNLKLKTGIIKASDYKEFCFFNDYLNIENFFLLNQPKASAIHPHNILLQFKFIKKLININPDIIHYINTPTWYSPLPIFRKKTVLTIHDPFPHSGETSIKKSLNYWTAMHFYKRFILLNNTQVKQFSEYWKIPESNIFTNKMGPFDGLTLYNKKNFSNGKYNILFFGRISPYKGVEYLLQAMEIIHSVIPNAKLIVAGNGTYYFDKIKYENLDYIEFINRFIGPEELAQLIASSDVVCCPYIDATQSGVVLSAFALNKPVVATDVGGMSDYITNGISGRLVNPKDIKNLAEALIDCANTDIIEEYTKNIKKLKCNSEISWSTIVNKYINFYNSIIKSIDS